MNFVVVWVGSLQT